MNRKWRNKKLEEARRIIVELRMDAAEDGSKEYIASLAEIEKKIADWRI